MTAGSSNHGAPPKTRSADSLQAGPLDELLGFQLARATLATTELFERHIGKPFGLSKVEFSMLMLLLANGPLIPKRLAKTLALTPPKTTMLLDRMQGRDLLRRERSEVDRRSQYVVLTEQGTHIARSAAAAAPGAEAALANRLSRAERAILFELLEKVARL